MIVTPFNRVLASLVLVFGVAPALVASTGQERAVAAGTPLIGAAAPALQLTTIDGERIDLGKFYGHKAVYLKFWATWCVPCREQMPHFERTFEHAGGDLAVIAVNVGFNDTVQDIKAYRASVGLKMPIVIDDGRLASALNLRVTPQHVVIGRDGKILYIGHLADDRLENGLTTARTVSLTTAVGGAVARAPVRALGVGTKLPPMRLRAADGANVPLRDPNDARPTVLVFLSPWCESYLEKSRPGRSAACRVAREQSERLARDSRRRWVGIASGLWAADEDLADYRKEKQVTLPLLLDETGAVFRRFGVTEVPTLFVIDGHGRIQARIDRVTDHLEAELNSVAEPAAGAERPH
jgi:peroxiredoxin